MVLKYNYSPFSGSTKKKYIMAISTSASECVSLAITIQHMHVTKRILKDIKIIPDDECVMLTENPATCAMVLKSHGIKSIKFIYLTHQYIQHMIQFNLIKIKHVQASGQPANMFTKPLQSILFYRQCKILHIFQSMSKATRRLAIPNGGSVEPYSPPRAPVPKATVRARHIRHTPAAAGLFKGWG